MNGLTTGFEFVFALVLMLGVVVTIHELGQQGVQFATFPESVVPYYPYFSFIQSPHQIIGGREYLKLLNQAVTVPSPATNAIGETCRQADMVVAIGVNERDGGTLYNTQLLFDADGSLIQRRRKTTPTYHERMIWGQGDGSGLRAVESMVGRIGQDNPVRLDLFGGAREVDGRYPGGGQCALLGQAIGT